METVIVDLPIILPYKHLNGRCIEHITNTLRNKYINKLFRNIIIQNFTLDVDNDGGYIMSTLDMRNSITVRVKVTKFIGFKVGDVVEGIIDLNNNPPLFRGEHLKLTINNIQRQSDNIITSDGTKFINGDKCTGKIVKLTYIEGTHYFNGSIVILTNEVSSNEANEANEVSSSEANEVSPDAPNTTTTNITQPEQNQDA